MQEKVLVLDIDGTLTNSKKEITEATKQGIWNILQHGHKVILASGRPTPGMRKCEEELELKKYGVSIALDDFGTGNSSLSLALELPVDELKVDMSFIKDIEQKPQNQSMVQSIVDYANRTNTETCIEGIENQEVSDYIHQFGATWYQGYFYSKPVPIDQFETLLDVPH